ncbi:MAG: glycosyltransferase family 2 protein [Firmicutes bacterium]|nr:glycosyltransferase family 2 protein [Bacillota bacterium]
MKNKFMTVSAIIPAYNEEGWVGKTVQALHKLKEVKEVIVIDDGSTDNTFSEALDAGAIVYRIPVNKGKSRALREGVKLARGDFIAFVDADLKNTAVMFRELISCVLADQADMAIASFSSTKKAGLGLVKLLAYWGILYHTGKKMTAPLSGQRVMKRFLWESINFYAEGFAAEVSLTIESLKKGFRIKEIPLNMKHRFRGNDYSAFLHRGEQFCDILKFLFSAGP